MPLERDYWPMGIGHDRFHCAYVHNESDMHSSVPAHLVLNVLATGGKSDTLERLRSDMQSADAFIDMSCSSAYTLDTCEAQACP